MIDPVPRLFMPPASSPTADPVGSVGSAASGKSIELLLASELLGRGHKVAIPIVDDDAVDMIVNYRTTVQVKSTSYRDERDRIVIKLGTLPVHVDVLVVRCNMRGTWWHIPRDALGPGKRLKLSEAWHRGPSTWVNRWDLFNQTPWG